MTCTPNSETTVQFRHTGGSDIVTGRVVGRKTKRTRGITTKFLIVEVEGCKFQQMIFESQIVRAQ